MQTYCVCCSEFNYETCQRRFGSDPRQTVRHDGRGQRRSRVRQRVPGE